MVTTAISLLQYKAWIVTLTRSNQAMNYIKKSIFLIAILITMGMKTQETAQEESQAIATTVNQYEDTIPQVKTYKPDASYSAPAQNAPARNYPASVESNPAVSTTPIDTAPIRSYPSSTNDRFADSGVTKKGYETTQSTNPLTSVPTQTLYGLTPEPGYVRSTSDTRLSGQSIQRNYIQTTNDMLSVSYAPPIDESVPLGARVAGQAPERNYLSSTSSALKDYAPIPSANGPPLKSGVSARPMFTNSQK